MTARLMALWIVLAAMGLAVIMMTTLAGQDATAAWRLEKAARAVGADWTDTIVRRLDPRLPLAALPGLGDHLPALLMPRLGLVGVAALAADGQVLAAAGATPTQTLGWNGPSTLPIPFYDWTGALRGSLVFSAVPPTERSWRLPFAAWPEAAFILTAALALAGLLRRVGWRALSPGTMKLFMAGSLGFVLLVCSLSLSIRSVALEEASAAGTLTALGARLDKSAKWAVAPLETRLARIGAAVPEIASLTVETRRHVGANEAAPPAGFVFEVRTSSPTRVTMLLDDAHFRAVGALSLVKGAMIALTIALLAPELMGLVLPATVRPRGRRAPEGVRPKRILRPYAALASLLGHDRPLAGVTGCAVAMIWPALLLTGQPAPAGAPAGLLLGPVCVVLQALGLAAGATLAQMLVERRGWRWAGLPGAVAAFCGTAALCAPLASPLLAIAWGLTGFGAGLAMIAAEWRLRSGVGQVGRAGGAVALLPAVKGQLAGLALGTFVYAVAGAAWAAPLGLVLWAVVVIVIALMPNDAAAPLRYFASWQGAGVLRPRDAAWAIALMFRTVPLIAEVAPLALLQIGLSRAVPALEMAAKVVPVLHLGIRAMPGLGIE